LLESFASTWIVALEPLPSVVDRGPAEPERCYTDFTWATEGPFAGTCHEVPPDEFDVVIEAPDGERDDPGQDDQPRDREPDSLAPDKVELGLAVVQAPEAAVLVAFGVVEAERRRAHRAPLEAPRGPEPLRVPAPR